MSSEGMFQRIFLENDQGISRGGTADKPSESEKIWLNLQTGMIIHDSSGGDRRAYDISHIPGDGTFCATFFRDYNERVSFNALFPSMSCKNNKKPKARRCSKAKSF